MVCLKVSPHIVRRELESIGERNRATRYKDAQPLFQPTGRLAIGIGGAANAVTMSVLEFSGAPRIELKLGLSAFARSVWLVRSIA